MSNTFQILQHIGSESSLEGMEIRLAESQESLSDLQPVEERSRGLEEYTPQIQFAPEELEALANDGFTVVQPKKRKSMRKDEIPPVDEAKQIEELQPIVQDGPSKRMNMVYAVSAAAVATIGLVIFKVMRR